MPRRLNGGVLGPNNTPTTTSASGVWSLLAEQIYRSQGIWPLPSAAIIQSFTASGNWTAPTGVTQIDSYLVVAGGGGGRSEEHTSELQSH